MKLALFLLLGTGVLCAADVSRPSLPDSPTVEQLERLTGAIDEGNASGAPPKPPKAAKPTAADEKFCRPELPPLPAEVSGVKTPVLSLDGGWKFNFNPPADYWLNEVDPSAWPDIAVPGEAVMQGLPINDFDVERAYKRRIRIPDDFKGRRIFLRFDGVYTYARVWVNGRFVRDHHGAFTPWNCEITGLVKPGEAAWLTVGVSTSRLDEYIENMTLYSRHNLLGIIRPVRLVALPQEYLSSFHAETDFDADYANATLKVSAAVALRGPGTARVELSLKDPHGRPVALTPDSIVLSAGYPEAMIKAPVAAPLKWDAEHPHLYTLEASVRVNGQEVERVAKAIGFRKVEIKGKELWVNGRPVKLRGVAMHDVHALAGRAVTPAMTAKALRLFKEGNANYIRTAHYPRSEGFYEECDRIGLYVEDDAPLVHDAYADAPKTPDLMALNIWAEQIEAHRDHPSVILWEAGNETPPGTKLSKMADYLRSEDRSRPLVWTSAAKNPPPQDCLRDTHYPASIPPSYPRATIHDEFAHVSNYNIHTLKRDPNVRNHWGQCIKDYWEKMHMAEGCVGGAIWAAIDDVFHYSHQPLKEMSGTQPQGGEWGIVDSWLRPKPEYWLTKKAYSPVRIPETPLARPAEGGPLRIPVANWFDHADLSEVRVRWTAGNDTGVVSCPAAAPGGTAWLTLPARAWKAGECVNLKCEWAGMTIDEYNLPIGDAKHPVFPESSGPAPTVTEDSSEIRVTGREFRMKFSKSTGKIESAEFKGAKLLEGGPDLNLSPVVLSDWKLGSVTATTAGGHAVVTITGTYDRSENSEPGMKKDPKTAGFGAIGATFVVKIDANGLMTTDFTVTNPPPPNNAMRRNTGYEEVGITYVLPASVDRVTWDRKALWSAYPDDHIGRPRGTAIRIGRVPVYREEPTWPWSQDEKTFYLFGAEDKGGRASNDFRSSRENVWFYSALLADSDNRVRVESDAAVAVRPEVLADGRVALHVNPVVGYPSLQHGNSFGITRIASGYGSTVSIRLTDSRK